MVPSAMGESSTCDKAWLPKNPVPNTVANVNPLAVIPAQFVGGRTAVGGAGGPLGGGMRGRGRNMAIILTTTVTAIK